MGVFAGIVAVVSFFVIAFMLSLIPAWLLLLAYNYVAEVMGHADITVPVTFWTVVVFRLFWRYYEESFPLIQQNKC